MPFRQLGVATSNLTFFRQIGGTIALAFVGTIFGDDVLRSSSVRRSSPRAFRRRRSRPSSRAAAAFDLSQLTGVGRPRRDARRRCSPPEAQVLIPNIVEGIHGAFSLATAQTFWLGVVGAAVAAVAALAIKEIPLRATNEAPVPTVAIDDAQAAKAPAAKPATSAD